MIQLIIYIEFVNANMSFIFLKIYFKGRVMNFKSRLRFNLIFNELKR